ncbi:MAG: winged helix-turn-helix domain-containing protein [Deltaproteobacteria bacterium]|nr:winged helix-turn-helix domain-containing protein [Deltaproteobacteria bacterium]
MKSVPVPGSARYTCGVWTGPMIGNLINDRFGVRYNNHHIPRLLHELGFSVQRPRKRLSRADADAQDVWIRKTFPSKKNLRLPRSRYARG